MASLSSCEEHTAMTSTGISSLFKPEQLAPVRSVSLRARLIVEGMIAGLHKSPYHGFSAEFLEYRPYSYGDAVRRIDWRKYAKTDRTVVKLFEDETNLYAHLLVDKSGSMAFGTKGLLSKHEYARTLAASLAWILVRQRDAVGLALFDSSLNTFIPPRSTNVQLKTILAHLQAVEPGGPTGCADSLHEVARMVNKRGLCILVSDFFDDPDRIIDGLRHLRFKRQDVVAFWVADPFELEFARRGSLKLRDLESGEEVVLDGETASHFYREGFAGHRERLVKACRELRVDLEIVSVREPFQKALLRTLEKRGRLY